MVTSFTIAEGKGISALKVKGRITDNNTSRRQAHLQDLRVYKAFLEKAENVQIQKERNWMALKLFIKRFLGHCRASGHCARHVRTELATPQPQMGVGGRLFSLRCQGGFLSFLCPYTKKLCPVHRHQNCPWEAVNAETRNPQPILSSVLTTVTDAKGALHRSHKRKRAVCSCFCLNF